MTSTVYLGEMQLMATGDGQAPAAAPPAIDARVLNRPSFAHVEVALKPGEKIRAGAGKLLWKDGLVDMHTDCYGGLCASWYRTCARESFCQNEYTGAPDGSRVAFGFDLPGDILPFYVDANFGWILSKDSFICSTPNVSISARFPGMTVCLCSGEGPFLTHVTSAEVGTFFAGSYGALQRHDVPEGRTFLVSSGLFFACKDSTAIEIKLASGCKTCICGGEGFVMVFRGPCTVYTQNRDPSVIERLLKPSLPSAGGDGKDKNQQQGGAGGAPA